DLLAQSRRAAGDLRGAKAPAVLGHPHQHAAAPVQVHTHDLPAVIVFHWGLPCLVETDALQLPASAREREAPLLHRIRSTTRASPVARRRWIACRAWSPGDQNSATAGARSPRLAVAGCA